VRTDHILFIAAGAFHSARPGDLIPELQGRFPIRVELAPLEEQDLVRILRHPATMIGSDGEVPIFGQASPHPRSYGTFVRVLGVYAREKGVITLEEAVRKMTSFPAARTGLADRGVLRPGMKADLAVFDPATVKDTATFEQPHQYAVGVSYVVVNGEVVFENGAMTAARPGRVLYGPGHVKK